MQQRPWTLDEIDAAHAFGFEAFAARYPDRTFDAWRIKRGRTQPAGVKRDFVSDKVVGEFNWREANGVIRAMQDLKAKASFSQDTSTIEFDTNEPICIVGLSDVHVGSFASDHDLLARITDEILETPNLYVALLGDLEQLAIKMRGVLEVSDNLLPPELQHRYIESWLTDIEHKVAISCWDNHSVVREEDAAGFSMLANILKRRVVYHNGIGHPDIRVGNQTYRFAVTHKWRSRSATNPCQGGVVYLQREGHDRQIAMAGDSHTPGVLHFTHGPTPKLSLNAGSTQLHSGYARRFFSLTTHPVFPCVVLWPDEHRFTGLWSVADWVKLRG